MSRKSDVLSLALLCVSAMAWAPTQAQGYSPEDLAKRTIKRRAIEAVIWGMPAVNLDLMLQAMIGSAKGKPNQIVYWSRLPDWKNQTLTPNPDVIYLMPFFNTKDAGPMVLEIPPANGGVINGTDPPPLKWSALRYGFRAKEDHDAEEETQARGDRCEAAPGGRAGFAGAERCRRGTLDWGYGGHVLSLAPGVWWAQERSGQATEGSRD